MNYAKHFALVDDVAGHFDGAIKGLDAFTVTRYAGLYAVSSAAVLELALKEIVIGFAASRDPVFGDYIASRYEFINGRIKLSHIKQDHLEPFGKAYLKNFDRLVTWLDAYGVKRKRGSLVSAYGNLLTCRHKFAHEGATTCTYDEVKSGFEAGKRIMACLHHALS
jgi:hypothetical protein